MSSPVNPFRGILLIGIFLFTYSFTFAQSKQDAVPPRTGSISGHVLIDNKAAAGVEVGALHTDSNRRIASAQTKTDSEGYYHLSGLTAATYQVTAFAPNLISGETSPPSPYSPPNSYLSKTVLLAAGEDATEIDLKLARGGVITGRVTDADDQPVVEERVSLQQVTEPGQPLQRISSMSLLNQTDDRGVYRIYGIPPGRYRVSVGQSSSAMIGSVNGYYLLTYHPDTSDPSRATLVEVAAGAETTNVDIKVGGRGNTHTISGRVVDAENGLPLSGLRVGLQILRETPGTTQQTFSLGTYGVTEADGTFGIPGAMTGRYGVYVSSDAGPSDFYSDPVLVNVADQDVEGIEVKALRGTSISGSIVPESMELRELLRQVPGLRVVASVFPADGQANSGMIRSYGTSPVAADGSFTVTGLRPGRAALSVSARDPSQRPSVVKVTAGGVGLIGGFEIDRQPVSGIQLVVAYGTGVIRGTVTFQGAALTDFHTQVMCHREGVQSYASVPTVDARGHFTVRPLAPGTYDCTLQLIPLARPPAGPVSRPPVVPHQTVNVSNEAEAEVNFLVDLTPKGVGP